MENLVIEGGLPLRGEISVSGSKNAALPILMASILLNGPAVFTNVPDLRDIHTTLRLLEILGCPCSFRNGRVEVSPGPLQSEAPYDLVKTMARLGAVSRPSAGPAWCGPRRHGRGLRHRRASRESAPPPRWKGWARNLNLKKVTSTANAPDSGARISSSTFPPWAARKTCSWAACLAEGETVLENVAREPEVVDLARFLIRCGAEIEGHGSSVIRVRGVRALNGCEYAIMPDRIEAGTFLAAAGITGGELLLRNCPYDDMGRRADQAARSGHGYHPEGGRACLPGREAADCAAWMSVPVPTPVFPPTCRLSSWLCSVWPTVPA